MELALIVVVLVIAVAILTLVAVTFRARETGLPGTEERLDSLNQRLGEVAGQASKYQDALTSVNQAVGGLMERSQSMLEVGREVQKLQKVLQAPTLRGEVGELMLTEILQQMLPRDFYDIQHTFRNGSRVDAVIRLAQGLVPVDSKFPLEAFQRVMEAEDAERKPHLRQFRTSVKRHIDDIADKYICPGETLDFALMYIPAENVYYEIILKGEEQEDILKHAWARHVFPTSPNTLYAYLQVITLGLRGMQVEQNAKQMLDSLTRLKGDFDSFAEDYRLVGTHLGRAKSKYEEALPKLESINRALPGQLATDESSREFAPSDLVESEEQGEADGGEGLRRGASASPRDSAGPLQ